MGDADFKLTHSVILDACHADIEYDCKVVVPVEEVSANGH
jgi:hypothetical protein